MHVCYMIYKDSMLIVEVRKPTITFNQLYDQLDAKNS